MDDVSYRKLYKQVMKQEKRESRVRQLELILTIVTTVALIFVCFVVAVLGIIKLNSEGNIPIVNDHRNENVVPMPEIYTPENSRPV